MRAIVLPAALILASACGCGGERGSGSRVERQAVAPAPAPLAIRVLADSGRSYSLSAPPPRVTASLARVTPSAAGVPSPPLPSAAPDSVVPEQAPEPEPVAAGGARLLPPILKRPGTLVPPRAIRRATAIELDVLVDVTGRVAEVRYAGGDRDSALFHAARRCAATMEFYPAQLAGRPVEVWCRQRFELTPH